MIEHILHIVLSDADREAIAKIKQQYALQYDGEAVHLALQLAARRRPSKRISRERPREEQEAALERLRPRTYREDIGIDVPMMDEKSD